MSNAKHDKRIDYIEFSTTDLTATKAFYTTVFGWRFTDWGDTYISFEDGRLDGGFYKADAPSAGSPTVILYALDLEATEASIKAAGGTITKEIFPFPGGRRFHFADPTGNALAVWSDPVAG